MSTGVGSKCYFISSIYSQYGLKSNHFVNWIIKYLSCLNRVANALSNAAASRLTLVAALAGFMITKTINVYIVNTHFSLFLNNICYFAFCI